MWLILVFLCADFQSEKARGGEAVQALQETAQQEAAVARIQTDKLRRNPVSGIKCVRF